MKVWAVVVAGGSGVRFGGPKHACTLGGVELWRRCVDVFHSAGVQGVVVVGDVPGGVPAGERRRDSVARGLQEIPDDADWVLIHDAARPLVTPELINRVLERASNGDVDGVVPALSVTDTLKQVDGDRIVATVDRANLVAVQTPQAFRVAVLKAAHLIDSDDATDDAALVERTGGVLAHVLGEPSNVKITFGEDLSVARAYLARRSDSG
ncbi:MAG: IspD/TarI family cytidylyltransferase [Actinomycetota bacterium]|mgnify:CR=1 FL=1|nr:IspD/TarI family cytidylyltransferase [Actinomycetota bacterium]